MAQIGDVDGTLGNSAEGTVNVDEINPDDFCVRTPSLAGLPQRATDGIVNAIRVLELEINRASVRSIAGFTSGPVLGLFLLGALTSRATQRGALAGLLAGISVLLFCWSWMEVSWQWYVVLGSTVTFVVGSTFRR